MYIYICIYIANNKQKQKKNIKETIKTNTKLYQTNRI